MGVLKSILTLMGGNYEARDYNSQFSRDESAVAYYKREDLAGTSYTLQSSLTSNGTADASPGVIPKRFRIDTAHVSRDRLDHFIPPVIRSVISGEAFNGKVPITDEGLANQVITAIPVGMEAGQQDDHPLAIYSANPRGILQLRMSERGLNRENTLNRIALAEYVANALEPILDTSPEFTRREAVRRARDNLNTVEGATAFLEGLQKRWQAAIEAYSPETGLHVGRVTELAGMLARSINKAETGPMQAITISDENLHLLELSAQLHDLGKLYTPLNILESGIPAPGTRHELGGYDRTLMERHAQDVYDVLDIPGMETIGKVRDVAAAHHVYANGKGGYPEAVRQKLMEKKGVPFESKLLAVADIFEALTALREYRGGNGLALSTALTIMSFDVQKGAVDPQIFRFAVEHGVFEEYAQKYSKQQGGHIKPVDWELLEKLGYSGKHIQRAQELKKELCENEGISMAGLESFLRIPPDAAKKKAYEIEQKRQTAPDTIDKRDTGFPAPDKLAGIAAMKAVLAQELNPPDAPFYSEPEMTSRTSSKRGNAVPASAFRMRADDMYINKLFSLTGKDADELEKTKAKIAARVFGESDNTPTDLEHMVKWHILQKSGLSMGVFTEDSSQVWHKKSAALMGALEDIERDNLAAVKQKILSTIPAAPLSESENLTLFAPRRHIERAASVPTPG